MFWLMWCLLTCSTLFRVAKSYIVRFLAITKLLHDLSFLPSFELQNSFFQMDVLPLVLEALNFEDKFSIRRGECNTPIKTHIFSRWNLLRRSY
jgi:hypothetical protein